MKLPDVYADSKFGLSFELFPPKTAAGEKALQKHVAALSKYKPSYITCTYGAGGSTQDKTLDIITGVKQQHAVPVASHLTCVNATVEELRKYLSSARDRGVDHIVALRGDPPAGETAFKVTEGGFQYASELVSFIKSEFDFGIAVGGYPEKHQEAASMEDDLKHLKHKIDCGADVVITQLFYDNDDFHRFRDSCDKLGITIPLVPGLLPVTNLGQIKRISSMCGAKLPKTFIDRLGEKGEDDADWQFKVGVEHATEQVQQLVDAGVPGVHFYVLNKSHATSQVLDGVKLPS